MKKHLYILILLFIIFYFSLYKAFANLPLANPNQSLIREIAILDLTKKNNETNSSNLFSALHICRTMGISYVQTDSVKKAINYSVILTTSEINCSTFSASEQNLINKFVNDGGIIIAPQIGCSSYNSLFGISAFVSSTKRHRINWIDNSFDASLRWLNDSLERTISLGSYNYADVISSRSYNITSATALAYYDDNSVAVTINHYGNGAAYALGIALNNIILRNQLNQDYEAQRTYGENFEPTSDVIMLFIKGVFAKHLNFASWKNSAPLNYKSVLIMTHDIDAQASMDTMKYFADYEHKHNVRGEYLITTHYISDCNDHDYYSANIEKINYVLQKGQYLGSHSVGHFEDFDNSAVFPIGSPGNNSLTYTPHYNCTLTTGGTAFGECEVSKKLLENDVSGLSVKSFRSGYLAFNRNQINVLDSLGYHYDLTQSANDVLTHFPYQQHREQRFNGRLSNVFELPLSMDADPITQDNYLSVALNNLAVINKIRDNNAVIVVLLHPTHKEWKLKYEDYLLTHIPDDIKIMGIEDFGDYWRLRESLNIFTQSPDDSTLNITLSNIQSPLSDAQKLQSIIISNAKNLKNIYVNDKYGVAIQYYKTAFTNDDIAIYFKDEQDNSLTINSNPRNIIRCIADTASFSVDVSGTMPLSFQWYHNNLLIPAATSVNYQLSTVNYPDSGRYFCIITNRFQKLTTETAVLKVYPSFNALITPLGKFIPVNPQLETQNSKLETQNSKLETQNSKLETQNSKLETQNYFCDTIKLTSSNSSAISWQWKQNGSDIPNATNSVYRFSLTGDYNVLIKNNVGCSAQSEKLSFFKYNLPKPSILSPSGFSLCSGDSILLNTGLTNTDDFESGNLQSFPWTNSKGSFPWSAGSSAPYQGLFSARSALISNLQSSEIAINIYVSDDDSISFFRKLSSEPDYDFLSFYINGVLIAKWSGEHDWQKFKYNVSAGVNTFRWVYSKDRSLSAGSDCAWLDNIALPISVMHPVKSLSFQWTKNNTDIISATAANYFASANAYYCVSASDPVGCSSLSDPLLITIKNKPIVSLGNDTTIYKGSSLTLNAGADTNTYLWNNGSASKSLFVNSSALRNGKHVYYVDVTSPNSCRSSDTITVNIIDTTVNLCKFRTIAHRGGSSYDYPENTMLSLRQAFIEGAWACEVDVRMTSDNVLVLMHDSLVDRTTNASGILSQMSYSQISSLDAGSWKGTQFSAQKVPTLLEAIKLASTYKRRLYLDYKISDPEALSRVLAQSGAPPDIIILEPDALSKLALYHQYMPNTPSCYFGSPPSDINDTAFYAFLKSYGAIAFELPASTYYSQSSGWRKALKDNLHNYSLELWLYTVNYISTLKQLLEDGIDGIETDRPAASVDITCNNGDGGYFPEKRITGQWDFQNKDLSATIGSALHERGDTNSIGQKARFGLTSEFNIPIISGKDEKVMRVPPFDPNHYLEFYSNIAIQEDITGFDCDNQYTIIMDLLKPSDSKPYVALLQTSHSNYDDADVFINNSNGGIGILGYYSGTIEKNKWYRVSLVFNLIENKLDKYINGIYTGTTPLGNNALDGRFCLNNNWGVQASCFFSDDDYETDSLYVNSIQVRDYAMTGDEISQLGAVTGKIPTDINNNTPGCPVVYYNPKDTSLCEGNQAEFSITATENVNYRWQVNKGEGWTDLSAGNYSGQASPKLTVADVSTLMNNYKYRCIVKNQCAVTSGTATLNVIPFKKVRIISSSSDVICSGNSTELTANIGEEESQTSLNYQWAVNGSDIEGAINTSYNAKSTGYYTVRIADNKGCSALSDSILIKAYSLPKSHIYIVDTSAICSSDSVRLYSDSNNYEGFESGDFSSYNWLQNNSDPWKITNVHYYEGKYSMRSAAISNLQTSSIIYKMDVAEKDSISFYYKVSSEKNYDFLYFYINDIYVEGWSGEVDWKKFSFPVNAGINSFKWVYSKDKSLANGSDCGWVDKIKFPDTVDNSLITYQWLKDENIIQGATNSIYFSKTGGGYSLNTIRHPQMCSNISNNITVKEIAEPIIALEPSGKINLCRGETVTLECKVLSNSDYQYQWRMDGTEISGATNKFLSVNSSGRYDIVIKGKDKYSCSYNSKADTVETIELPTASITHVGQLSFCSGDSVILKANNGDGFKYQWKKDNINLQGATNLNFTAISPGEYSLFVTDNNNCTNSSEPIKVITHNLPLAILTPSEDTAFCSGDFVMLNAYKANGYKFQWYRNNTIIQGAILSSFKVSSEGSYNVVVTNENSCSSNSQTIKTTVNPLPSVKITASGSSTFCMGDSVILNINHAAGNTFQWVKDGALLTNATSSTYSAKVSGEYNISVTNIYNCTSTQLQNEIIMVNALPYVELGRDTSITKAQKLLLDGGPDGKSYLWNTGTNSRNITIDGTELATGDYVYSVIVTDHNNCVSGDSIKVNIRNIISKLTGISYYDNSQKSPLNNTKIYLTNSAGKRLDSLYTDNSGQYEFSNLEPGKYMLTPKITKQWGGANPVDALLINKYFVKLYNFRDLISEKAADVNKDNHYNPTDALNINRRFVMLINSFPAGDWISDKDTITISGSDVRYDIRSLCYGDVNGSYSPLQKMNRDISLVQVGELMTDYADTLRIPFRLTQDIELAAIGLKIKINSLQYNIAGIETSIDGMLYNHFENKLNADDEYQQLNIAWSADKTALRIIADDIIFTLLLTKTDKSIKDKSVSAELLPESVIADSEGNALKGNVLSIPKLRSINSTVLEEDIQVNCHPNPFNNKAVISFSLAQNEAVKLSVMNMLGENVRTLLNKSLKKGRYEAELDGSELESGIYFYKLTTAKKSLTGKIILIK